MNDEDEDDSSVSLLGANNHHSRFAICLLLTVGALWIISAWKHEREIKAILQAKQASQ